MFRCVVVFTLGVAVAVSGADEDLYAKAVKFLKSAKSEVEYLAAAKLLKTHLESHPDDAKATYALGYAKEKSKDKTGAMKCYRQVLAANAKTGNDPEEAEKAMRRLANLDPGFAAVFAEVTALESRALAAKDPAVKKALTDLSKAAYKYLWGGNEDMVVAKEAEVPAEPEAKPEIVEVGGLRYQYFQEPKTWFEAQAACEVLGGHLFVFKPGKDISKLLEISKGNRIWIGASDLINEGQWLGLDGQGLPRRFTRPQNMLRPDNNQNDFAFIGRNPQGASLFGAAPAQEKMSYICEWSGVPIKLGRITKFYIYTQRAYRVWFNGSMVKNMRPVAGVFEFVVPVKDGDAVAIEIYPLAGKDTSDECYFGANVLGTQKWWTFDTRKRNWHFKEARDYRPRDIEWVQMPVKDLPRGWQTSRRSRNAISKQEMKTTLDLPGRPFDLEKKDFLLVKVVLGEDSLVEIKQLSPSGR